MCLHSVLVCTVAGWRCVYIRCWHVLLQDGGVFTFGAGMYGQLGHNSNHCESLPRKVFELMGSEVTMLACGRLVSCYSSTLHLLRIPVYSPLQVSIQRC